MRFIAPCIILFPNWGIVGIFEKEGSRREVRAFIAHGGSGIRFDIFDAAEPRRAFGAEDLQRRIDVDGKWDLMNDTSMKITKTVDRLAEWRERCEKRIAVHCTGN